MDLGIGYNLYAGRKFSTTAPTESPLQQAVIAAWDMQEESGPLLPAKGGIEIPAFNSPGSVVDAFGLGVRGRQCDAVSSQRFSVADAPVFKLLDGRTFRWWFIRDDLTSSINALIEKPSDNPSTSGEQFGFRMGANGDSRMRVRNAANDAVQAINANFGGEASQDGDMLRIELSRDGNTITLRNHTFRDGVIFRQGTGTANAGAWTDSVQPLTLSAGENGGIVTWGPWVALDRLMTTEERAADLTPRLYGDL